MPLSDKQSRLGLASGQTVFGRLDLLCPLGRGGFAEVWKARDRKLENEVALKFIHSASPDPAQAWTLLRQEVDKLRLIRHPNVVGVHHLHHDDANGLSAVEMEFLSGGTFRDKLLAAPNGCFDVDAIFSWVEQLCSALMHVHDDVGLVHRDLKLQNIMFDGRGRLKVMDFGIARRTFATEGASTNFVPDYVCSPCYASPEQIFNSPPNVSDDVYALGVILYELLTGSLPILHPDPAKLPYAVLHSPVTKPNKRRADLFREQVSTVPSAWENTILACLAKSCGDRPPDVKSIWRILSAHSNSAPLTETATQAHVEAVAYKVQDPASVESEKLLVQGVNAKPRLKTRTAPVRALFDPIVRMISSVDLGIDLGTAETLIYVKRDEVISREASVVLIEPQTKRVLASGNEAVRMEGYARTRRVAIRPLTDGVVGDSQFTSAMLCHFFHKVHAHRTLFRRGPRVVISVPSGLNAIETRAVRNSALTAGARSVRIIEKPIAAALGCGFPIQDSTGTLIVHVGRSITEVAIVARSEIVFSRSVRVGGENFDNAIVQHLKSAHRLLIGTQMGEAIKLEIGAATPIEHELTMEISGRDAGDGPLKTIQISSEEIRDAVFFQLALILDAVNHVIRRCPLELGAGLVDRGLLLVGGGALLRGLDRLLAKVTGIRVHIPKDPRTAVIDGLGKMVSVP